MSVPISLYIDLGDCFTKSLIVSSAGHDRTRFPSVVASRLLAEARESGGLLLDPEGSAVPRFHDFDPASFPRARSYPDAERLVRAVRERPPPEGARFAGKLAAAYGADRRLLGHFPDRDVIDSLVRKALILSCAEEQLDVDATFVCDAGPKAEAVVRYSRSAPLTVELELESCSRRRSRRLRFTIRGTALPAPSCVSAMLPPALAPEAAGSVLLVDVGFLRTKLALLTPDGCLDQDVHALGAADIVRRVLRDGQEQGLIEDEFAVIRALEALEDSATIEVAGRRFDVRAPLASARRALEEELLRAAERAIVGHFQRRAEPCRAVALLGGGAILVGSGFAERIRAASIGVDVVWLAPDPSFILVEGARRLRSQALGEA